MKEGIRETVETPEGKRTAILSMLGGKSLTRLSRANALFIPNMWLRLYGWEIDSRVWVKVEINMDSITISPIDQKEANKMMEENNVSIKA